METTDVVISDQQLFFKARPEETAGKRYVWIEASNEHADLQDEKVLHEALWQSRDYFLAKGNLDLDHLSKIGLRMSPPIEDYYLYEIGRPVDVGRKDGRIYAKGCLYRGNVHAERVWKGLTEWDPPQCWYASVAGKILAREKRGAISVISECRWNNLALTQEAVNHKLKEPVSTSPIGSFLKAMEVVTEQAFAKALTAGYGTNVAQLTGGGALRRESLHGAHIDPYQRYREYASRKILKTGTVPSAEGLTSWAMECGFKGREALQAVTRFCEDLGHALHERKEAA